MAATTTSVAQAAVEAATKRSERFFALYIGILVVTGLVLAFFTWLV